jgi:flagellar export protein FliJ
VKKFIWPLQRLLDVKEKQEDAMRVELASLTQQAAAIRGRIMMLKMMLKSMLSDLKQLDPQTRMTKQQEFMNYVPVKDAEIQNFNRQLNEVEEQRKQKLQEMMELRKFRKGLEKLREKARDEHLQQENKLQQNLLDENTNASYARKVLSKVNG